MSLQAFVIGSVILGGLYLNNSRMKNKIVDDIAAGRRKFVTDQYGEKIIVEIKKGEWNYWYDKSWIPLKYYGDGNWKVVGDKLVNSGYSSKVKKNPVKNFHWKKSSNRKEWKFVSTGCLPEGSVVEYSDRFIAFSNFGRLEPKRSGSYETHKDFYTLKEAKEYVEKAYTEHHDRVKKNPNNNDVWQKHKDGLWHFFRNGKWVGHVQKKYDLYNVVALSASGWLDLGQFDTLSKAKKYLESYDVSSLHKNPYRLHGLKKGYRRFWIDSLQFEDDSDEAINTEDKIKNDYIDIYVLGDSVADISSEILDVINDYTNGKFTVQSFDFHEIT